MPKEGSEKTEEKEVIIPTKAELLAAIDGEEGGKPDEGIAVPNEDLSDIEKEATTHGWSAEGVEGKRNLSAEEFMDRQPLYDGINSLKKETRKLKDGISALMKERDVIRKTAREDTIQELKQQKIEAMDAGESALVVEIDDKILDEKAALRVEASEEAKPEENTDFNDWVENNAWYNQKPEMQRFANRMGKIIASEVDADTPLSEIYEEVTKEVKARFPTEFAGSRRGQPTSVEGADKGKGKQKSKYSVSDLPEDAQILMPNILRATGMSEEEYIKSYISA